MVPPARVSVQGRLELVSPIPHFSFPSLPLVSFFFPSNPSLSIIHVQVQRRLYLAPNLKRWGSGHMFNFHFLCATLRCTPGPLLFELARDGDKARSWARSREILSLELNPVSL